jgi:Galactose oxidase, central domain/Kelch motif
LAFIAALDRGGLQAMRARSVKRACALTGGVIVVLITLPALVPTRSSAASGPAPKRSTWGQILIVGAESGPQAGQFVAELYDPLLNRFAARLPVMNRERASATTTVISVGPNAGKILVAGGFASGGGPLASSELYDPATNTFAPGPNLTTDFSDHTATPIASGPRAGWILICGYTANDLYDPISNRFSPAPDTPNYQSLDHTATVIPFGPNKGKILIAGGDLETPREIQRGIQDPDTETEIYDPITNTFQRGPHMNTGRQSHTATVIRTGPNAGKVLLAGGWHWLGQKLVPLASTELYDPAINTFAPPSATAIMKTARAWHTATVISSGPNAGMILIAGGEKDDDYPFSSTELYDPETNRFIPGPPMRACRSQHVAITIASGPEEGKILIAGGVEQCPEPIGRRTASSVAFPPSTELYDPATNRFEPGPPMRGNPGDVTAVQLPAAPTSASGINSTPAR